MFGPHLIAEGYGCKNKRSLANKELLSEILNDLPALMNMTIIMPPQIMYYDGGEIPEDNGVSGFVIIAESHVAIHTFPEKGFFALDIFSCKPFDTNLALKYISDIYAPDHCEHHVFQRGREFPRSLGRAGEIIVTDRQMLKTAVH